MNYVYPPNRLATLVTLALLSGAAFPVNADQGIMTTGELDSVTAGRVASAMDHNNRFLAQAQARGSSVTVSALTGLDSAQARASAHTTGSLAQAASESLTVGAPKRPQVSRVGLFPRPVPRLLQPLLRKLPKIRY